MLFPLAVTADHILGVAALTPTIAVVAYGAVISANVFASETASLQGAANKEFVLQYANERQALFRTPDGLSLVMVGSSLSSAGHVEAIVMRRGLWTVVTDHGLSFAMNQKGPRPPDGMP